MTTSSMRRTASRIVRRLGRRTTIAAVVAAILGAATLASVERDAGADPKGWHGPARLYEILVWLEFVLIAIVSVAGGGATIAEERRRGTWDAICLTDWTDGEIARRKALGVLARAACIGLLAVPAHLACVGRGMASWHVIGGVHAVLIGSCLAMAGLGLLASAWTDHGLHGVALAAAAVLFPWFGGLDWLAGRGTAPALCRTLQPVRHLERTLGPPASGRGDALWPAMIVLVFGTVVLAAATAAAACGVRRHGESLPLRPTGDSGRRARSVGEDPVRWREARDPGGRRVMLVVTVLAIVGLLRLGTSAWEPGAADGRFGLSKYANGLLLILTLAPAVAVGLRCSVTLVDERTRGTLDLLVMTGRDGASVVRSKLAAILAPLGMTIPLSAAAALFAFSGRPTGRLAAGPWLAAGEMAVVSVATALVVAGPSLLISASARSTRGALAMGLILLAWIVLGPMAVALAASPWLPEPALLAFATSGPVFQVSIVVAHATRFHSPIGIPMLLGVLGAEVVLASASLIAAGRMLDRGAVTSSRLKGRAREP